MTREQLEHILRAATGITGADRFVVIGSQAILGQYPDPPPELIVSIEADVFTLRAPEDADLIDGSIGEGSPFHRTFGYYAHGVGMETAVLPAGWQDRLIALRTERTGGATGLCLEIHDLAVSKLAAGRPKDLEFVAALVRHNLAKESVINDRVRTTPVDEAHRRTIATRLSHLPR